MSPLPSTTGFLTIELLLAFSVGISFLCSAMMLITGNLNTQQQFSLSGSSIGAADVSSDSDGLHAARAALEDTLATLAVYWHATFATTSTVSNGLTIYPPSIIDISPCLKEVTAKTTWGRGQQTHLTTVVSNMKMAQDLGSDCDPLPSSLTWRSPYTFTSYTSSTMSLGALDVLDHTVYTADTTGQLHIIDIQNPTTPLTISSSFVVGVPINDIDVAQWLNLVTGERRLYAYLMRHDATTQLQVVDVTDPLALISSLRMSKSFTGANPPRNSFPQGWRLRYFENTLYALTRETAGYEFHIFDVHDPTTPQEIGPGLEINGTANDLAVVGITNAGQVYRLVFLATDRSTNEIMVLNVTNPTSPALLTSVDLPTNLDALSLTILGNRLYVGREKFTGGPEISVFTISYSTTSPLQVTLTPLGSGADTGSSVTTMQAVGEKLFAVTNQSSDSFQIWNTHAPALGLTRLNTTPLSAADKITGEIDYAHPYIYASSQSPQVLRLLSSPP